MDKDSENTLSHHADNSKFWSGIFSGTEIYATRPRQSLWISLFFVLFNPLALVILSSFCFYGFLGDCGGSGEEKICEDFVETFCSRIASCDFESKASCKSELNQVFSCSEVKAIRDKTEMESCVAQFQAMSCDDIEDAVENGLPAECLNQFQTY